MKNDAIKHFLNQYSSLHTQTSYQTQLNNYFKFIKIEPNKYVNNNRDYEKDIKEYWNTITNKPPKSRTMALLVIKLFLEENGIELPKTFWKKLPRRTKGHRAVTQDKVPTPNELKDLLQHTRIQGKALFLMACSSGMRIDELLHLTIDNNGNPEDIELDKDPVQINIPGNITKSGDPRITFISNEAKESLIQWLKIRDKYLQSAVNRYTLGKKSLNDKRIFPFSYHNAREMWITMINKTGLNQRDKTTDRYKYHIHTLRKFFRSRMPKAIGVDMTEFLMGHEGYLTREYRNYSPEDLAKEYKKGMENVTIFETPLDSSDIREQIAEKDKQIQELERKLNDMNSTLTKLIGEKTAELMSMQKQ